MDALLASIDWSQAACFGLVLARVSGALLAAPILGAFQIPPQVKAILIVLASAALYGPARPALGEPPAEPIGFVLVAVRELVLGLGLGFAVRLVFAAAELGGQIIATQIGLTLGSIVHPEAEQPSPPLVGLVHALAALGFFALDGHHLVFRAVHESFSLSPPSLDAPPARIASGIAILGGKTFVLAVQIAAPVLAAGLLANVGLAVVARAAPAINVFAISFGVPILVGLVVLAVAAPGAVASVGAAFQGLAGDLATLLGKL
jgi:flagellar biosynthetic protein FliR